MHREITHENGLEEIRICNPIHRTTLQIFYGNLDEFKLFLPPEARDFSIGTGKFIGLPDSNMIYLHGLTYNTLVHESLHCAYNWGRQVYQKNKDNIATEEFIAYSLDYIVGCVTKTKLWKKLKVCKREDNFTL